jgi:formylglycine-generating enzyme required for sulfatase activity
LGGTTPVGSFPKGDSPYGVSDMAGNVWERTASWYKAYAGNKRPTENYGEKYRVLKGGSWIDCSGYHCGISAPNFNRSFFNPGTKNNGFGFRCAKSL